MGLCLGILTESLHFFSPFLHLLLEIACEVSPSFSGDLDVSVTESFLGGFGNLLLDKDSVIASMLLIVDCLGTRLV